MLYRDVDGLTPLHHAAMFCNYDMISYLIKNGANVNARSYSLSLTREYKSLYQPLFSTTNLSLLVTSTNDTVCNQQQGWHSVSMAHTLQYNDVEYIGWNKRPSVS